MLLLHLVTTSAVARAGLVGLAAATSLAGFGSRSSSPAHHTATRVAVIASDVPQLQHSQHGPCSAARIHAMVIAERVRAHAALRAQMRAEEALARATIRIRRERAMHVAVHGPSGSMDGDAMAPIAPDVAALIAASGPLATELPAPPLLRPPDVVREGAAADSTTRDRGVRVLAAIAFFLIGLA